jgi:predicted RNase H-like HicB family nuclease
MSEHDKHEYIVKVHEEPESGMLWAEVLELPGCFASGATLDELREALEEAISLYLTDDPEGGVLEIKGAAAPHMEVGEMRVKVPA